MVILGLDSRTIREQYESARLSRYSRITKRVSYTNEQLKIVYDLWANHPYGREHLWDDYCDVRDGVPRGTNTMIRKERTLTPWIN